MPPSSAPTSADVATWPLAELSAATQRRALDVNAAGVLLGCRAAFAALRRSPRGCVVNLGSMSCV